MRSGKSAVQSTVLRCAYNPWLGRVSAPSPGPRPRPRPRTNCSINLLTMARWHRPVTGQSPASSRTNNLFINKHKTPPPRQKKLCRINSSNILVTSSISTSAVWTWMDMHWSDVSGSSLHHPRAPCNRASNEPSRRLREVLQSRRRPLLTLFSTVS